MPTTTEPIASRMGYTYPHTRKPQRMVAVVQQSGGLNQDQVMYGASAVTMDTKGDTNMDYVLPINDYSIDLQKEIDDAEWLGEFDRADNVKRELDDVKRMIDNGELYYPMF